MILSNLATIAISPPPPPPLLMQVRGVAAKLRRLRSRNAGLPKPQARSDAPAPADNGDALCDRIDYSGAIFGRFFLGDVQACCGGASEPDGYGAGDLQRRHARGHGALQGCDSCHLKVKVVVCPFIQGVIHGCACYKWFNTHTHTHPRTKEWTETPDGCCSR